MSQRKDGEIGPKAPTIKHLPAKKAREEIGQGRLDLRVEKQREIHGLGMGVLSDGTPFLTQRGLARLCGVQNAHIGTISSQWNDNPETPRIATIKQLMAARGDEVSVPHIEGRDGEKIVYAYPDSVSLAVLEYYAFEAGNNCKEEARNNFRVLAGKALQDFIYTQLGYDPGARVPDVWKQFHDRVSLTYSALPRGYFGVFKEMADVVVHLGNHGLHIDAGFVPDISVGRAWADYWLSAGLEAKYGARIKWEHNYPDYFPQAGSNPQTPWCYPEMALGEFRRWFREEYIGKGKFANYLDAKVKQRQLPASVARLAIASYEDEESLTAPPLLGGLFGDG